MALPLRLVTECQEGELLDTDTLVLRFFKVSDPASSFEATLERSPT